MFLGSFCFVQCKLTPHKRRIATSFFFDPRCAFLIFLPNLLWNIQNHFPFLKLQANIRRSGRDVALSPLTFFSQEILAMLPLSLPIWLVGLWYLFFHSEGKRFRVLGLGLGGDGPESSWHSAPHLLPVSRVPGFVRGCQCGVGTVAGGSPRAVD